MKESLVVRQIRDYLAAQRIFSIRVNTGVARMGEKRRFVKFHDLGAGAADILVVPPGATWIECKGDGGRQSPVQKLFEQMVTERGDRYIVAHSVDDLVEYL